MEIKKSDITKEEWKKPELVSLSIKETKGGGPDPDPEDDWGEGGSE